MKNKSVNSCWFFKSFNFFISTHLLNQYQKGKIQLLISWMIMLTCRQLFMKFKSVLFSRWTALSETEKQNKTKLELCGLYSDIFRVVKPMYIYICQQTEKVLLECWNITCYDSIKTLWVTYNTNFP